MAGCGLLLLTIGAACGSAAEPGASPTVPPGLSTDGGTDSSDGAAEPSDSGADAGNDAATAPVPVIYAVTQFAVLVKFDPVTNVLSPGLNLKGASSCTSNLTMDLAIDTKLNAIVTSVAGPHTLDLKTGACQPFGNGYNAEALAFLPAGTFSPSTEVLVGYFSPTKNYRLFDPTGASTTTIASPPGFGEATDIVSTSDGRTFVTNAGELTQINATTGGVVKKYGSLQMGTVSGLASWGTRLYGFTSDGNVYSVELDGDALTTPKLVAQSSNNFTGAASAVPVGSK